MEKEFDNSTTRFTQGESSMPIVVSSSAVFLFLAVGAVIAARQGSWGLVAVFLLVAIGTAVAAFQSYLRLRKLNAAESQSSIRWQAANPEVQRQNLNLEVIELSRILDMGSEQLSDLQSAYIVAEDLALRQIQQEEKIPLLRHVSVCEVPFNAVMMKGDIVYCAEVSFLVAPELRQDRIDAMLRKIQQVDRGIKELELPLRTRLMIVLITQLNSEDEARLRNSLGRRRFPDTPVEIEIRFLDFEALQRIYVTD